MVSYVFSAEDAVLSYLDDRNKTPFLMYSEENGMFLITEFSKSAVELTAYRAEHPDAAIVDHFGADIVTENISQEFFSKLIKGGMNLQDNPVLIEQSKALAAEVTKRPLFKEMTEGTYTPIIA